MGLSKCQPSDPSKKKGSLTAASYHPDHKNGKRATSARPIARILAVIPSGLWGGGGRASPGSYFMLHKNVVIKEDKQLLSEDRVQSLDWILALK